MGRAARLAGLVVVVLTSTAALADPPVNTNAPNGAAPATAPDPNEKICRRSPPTVGSMLPGPPVCHTRQQWQEIDARQQQSPNELLPGEMIRTH